MRRESEEGDIGDILWRVNAYFCIRFGKYCSGRGRANNDAEDMVQSALVLSLKEIQKDRRCLDGFRGENRDSEEYRSAELILRRIHDNVRDKATRPHRIGPHKSAPTKVSLELDKIVHDHRGGNGMIEIQDEIDALLQTCSKAEKAVAKDLIDGYEPQEIRQRHTLTRYRYNLIIGRLHDVLSILSDLQTGKPESDADRNKEQPGVLLPHSTRGLPEPTA